MAIARTFVDKIEKPCKSNINIELVPCITSRMISWWPHMPVVERRLRCGPTVVAKAYRRSRKHSGHSIITTQFLILIPYNLLQPRKFAV